MRKPKTRIMVQNNQNLIKIGFGISKNLKKWIKTTLIEENFVEKVEISVVFTNNEEIREYNKKFRENDKATDVLSFPMGDLNIQTGYYILGDIVISTEKAIEQSSEYGHSVMRELAFLTVHSVLHLLGYDHETSESEEKIMREKQTKILALLGHGR